MSSFVQIQTWFRNPESTSLCRNNHPQTSRGTVFSLKKQFQLKQPFPLVDGRRIVYAKREGIICNGFLLPVDPWAPSIDSASIASQLFAFSLFPYLGFLYFITKSKSAPKLTLFGFYFLLAFVGATTLPLAASIGGPAVAIGRITLFFIKEYVKDQQKKSLRFPPPPEVPGLPVIGNLLQLKEKKPHKTFAKWAEKYGPIYSVRAGSNTIVVLNTNDVAKEAMVTQYSSISKRKLTNALKILTCDKSIVAMSDYDEFYKQPNAICLQALSELMLRNGTVSWGCYDK